MQQYIRSKQIIEATITMQSNMPDMTGDATEHTTETQRLHEDIRELEYTVAALHAKLARVEEQLRERNEFVDRLRARMKDAYTIGGVDWADGTDEGRTLVAAVLKQDEIDTYRNV